MSEPRPLHRWFDVAWADFLQGTAVSVEAELDLSLKQQFLDLALTRKGPGPMPQAMPDGFDNLGTYNLVTFKSHQEALDFWAVWEVIGHCVNYRKQFSPSLNDLLPASEFRLYAVCVREPQLLA